MPASIRKAAATVAAQITLNEATEQGRDDRNCLYYLRFAADQGESAECIGIPEHFQRRADANKEAI